MPIPAPSIGKNGITINPKIMNPIAAGQNIIPRMMAPMPKI